MKVNNKSKIGIISMFYNSTNYGGILQAYALVKYLEKNGYNAEQICYDLYCVFPMSTRLKIMIKKYLLVIGEFENLKILKRNKAVLKAANKLVPHSSKVYREKSIARCVNQYSIFITGSDQVWHGEWPAYFLTFVPSSLKKIAYAVSAGKSNFNRLELEKIRNYTEDFSAVSVREADTLDILRKNMPDRSLELTLDPTLLLSAEEWNEVVAPKKVNVPYLFCYFLGSDRKMRKLASEYAKAKKMIIVTIPHMMQQVEPNDIGFGDVQVYEDAAPQDFLSYIKYADAVFTDSFHASVFSNIFQVQYYVFSRSGFSEMDNRIRTLTNMFHSGNHFIDNEEDFTLEHIQSIENIDYGKEIPAFSEMQERSRRFIINAVSHTV